MTGVVAALPAVILPLELIDKAMLLFAVNTSELLVRSMLVVPKGPSAMRLISENAVGMS